jgi:hypothetical protein
MNEDKMVNKGIKKNDKKRGDSYQEQMRKTKKRGYFIKNSLRSLVSRCIMQCNI